MTLFCHSDNTSSVSVISIRSIWYCL